MIARSPFDLLEREFDELYRRAFGNPVATGQRAGGMAPAPRAWIPAMDVFVQDGELHLRLECPGIDPAQDVDIEVGDGRLTIRGDRRREEAVEESGYWHREMAAGHFERTIGLPQGVDPSGVRAGYDAGILDITVPLPQAQTNKVKVEIGPSAGRRELNES